MFCVVTITLPLLSVMSSGWPLFWVIEPEILFTDAVQSENVNGWKPGRVISLPVFRILNASRIHSAEPSRGVVDEYGESTALALR